MLVQMTKIQASAEYSLDAGKFYRLSDAFVAELLKDNACIVCKESDLPKTKKGKAMAMPDPRPDPQHGSGPAPKPVKVADLDTGDDDEDEEEDK